MVIQPGILFADEPTGNLDQATGEAVSELMFALCAESGAALVLVTHDPRLAARCREQHRLDAGRLTAAPPRPRSAGDKAPGRL